MNKLEILDKLKNCGLDKDKVIIISGASLTVQGIINNTEDIDLACSKEYYDSLDWKTKIGAYGIEIKYNDIFEIGYNLYYPENFVIINGYKFMDVYKCLEIKEELNREKDKEIINKIKNYIKNSS